MSGKDLIVSDNQQRMEAYHGVACRLRGLAQTFHTPEVREELLWLAQSYQWLAEAPEIQQRIVDDCALAISAPDEASMDESLPGLAGHIDGSAAVSGK